MIKYRTGDEVRIKTWEEMKEEFGLTSSGDIKCRCYFLKEMEIYFKKYFPDRIVEVVYKSNGISFRIKSGGYHWPIDSIKEKIVYEPIHSRFEILDIR